MTIVVEGTSAEQAQSEPASAPRQRLVAGRFRLIEQLGRGGMGRVYRAHDEVLERPVAVKLIYDDAVRDRDLQHACALEARAAARLNHPGIVRILDSGFDDGHCYVVMSLVEGRPLNEILREDGPIPVERALDLGIQIADALAAAHREGVIHCDVKPGNLLVDANWRIRLVDFGIARVTSSTTGLTGELLQGSAQYVAPEQVEGASVDGRTDLYALGTVLHEMLVGRTPFGGGTIASILARRLVNDPPPFRESNPTVPPQVEQVILKALARDPDERIQTAAELRDALMTARQTAPIFPAPPRGEEQRRQLPRWTEIRAASPALPRIDWGRAHQAVLSASTQAADWTAHTGRWAREMAGTVLPDAMTRANLLTPAHRPTLRSGVGLAVVLGLVVGISAAKCGVAGVSAEAVIASESSAVTVEATVAATSTPVAAPVEVAPLAESAAPVATDPPAPTPARPTATPLAPTPTSEPALAEIEPTAAPPPPAQAAPRAPVRALSAAPPAQAAPVEPEPEPAPPTPADKPEKQSAGDEKKPSLSNTPRSGEKTPEERAKSEAKQNEPEKRNDPPRPARASTLAPYVNPAANKPEPPKPEPPKQEPPRQQAAPQRPQPAPIPDTKRPDPPKPDNKPAPPKNEQRGGGNDKQEDQGDGNGNKRR